MFKEYQQLKYGPIPGNPVFGPINNEELSGKESRRALKAVNLIKEKICGKIKGRTCANGGQNKRYLKEHESVYSPTCLTEY